MRRKSIEDSYEKNYVLAELDRLNIGIEEDHEDVMFWNKNVIEDLAEMTEEQIIFLKKTFGNPSVYEYDGYDIIGTTYYKKGSTDDKQGTSTNQRTDV